MIEYNGNIYLSANSVPKLDPNKATQEAGMILHVFMKYTIVRCGHPERELTELMRNFTAALLVCDPK